MAFDLSTQNLSYGKHTVLNDLNLIIKPGEKVAIIGESGAGKSTLLKALREIQPHNIAWCPQQPGLVGMLNCHHNIYMGQLEQHHFLVNLLRLVYPGKKTKQDIQTIAQKLSIAEVLYRPCEQISGGQQQRCAIARALYSRQDIFLGDEPFSAVDEYQAQQILTLLCESFPTLVIALHDVDLALSHCQRIIALKDGKILLDQAAHTLTATDLAQVYH